MNSSVLCCAVLLLACLYISTNQVNADEEEPMCPYGMKPGDVKRLSQPCVKCTCDDDGFGCKTCSAGGLPKPGCHWKAKQGIFPLCCQKEEVCP